MRRQLDEQLIAVLRRMQNGRWMMARQIGADSTQYQWLIRRGYIQRQLGDLHGRHLKPRYDYSITRDGLELLGLVHGYNLLEPGSTRGDA